MRSLTRNTRGVRGGVCWSSGIRTKKSDKLHLLTQTCIKPTTKWLVHILEYLGARTSHGQLWTHKTHHGPDSGEATTFPHIVFSAPFHNTCIQMTFVPRLPRRSPETVPVWTPSTLRRHNSLPRPPIGMRSQAKL